MITRNSTRSTAAAALLLAGGLALAGCTAPPPADTSSSGPFNEEALVAAAEAEGTLTIYTSQGPDVAQQVVDDFLAAYPAIGTDMLRVVSSQLAGRFSAEAAAGSHTADVFITVSTDIFDQEPDLFVDLTQGEFGPNFDAWPEDAVKGTYVEFSASPHLITFNTDAVDEDSLPDEWDGVLDLDLTGAAIMDPRASDTFLSWYKLMRDTYGDGFLEDLGASGATFVESGVTASQEVAAGAYTLAFPTSYSQTLTLIADGAPVSTKTVDPAHSTQAIVGIPANAPHPNAARLFFNWFLSEEVQKANCQGANSPLGYEELDGCPALPESYVPVTPASKIPGYEKDIIVELLGLEG